MAKENSKSVLGSLPSERPQRRSQRRASTKPETARKKQSAKTEQSSRKSAGSQPQKESVPKAGYAVSETKNSPSAENIAKDAVGGVKELLETGLAFSQQLLGETLKRLRK